ncbi:Uncharacterized protein Rs2_22201 [Raphanus sativus]|nr:Uncharacterized protein Rs2_22201 [Raphanus sativus]
MLIILDADQVHVTDPYHPPVRVLLKNSRCTIYFPHGGHVHVWPHGRIWFQCGEKGMLPVRAFEGCEVFVPSGAVVTFGFGSTFDEFDGLKWYDDADNVVFWPNYEI